jgi:hypothetical protein
MTAKAPLGSEVSKEAAAATTARARLARVAQKPRHKGVSGITRLGPSRLGGTDDDEQADAADL